MTSPASVKPKIILTNDDGVRAPGLNGLRAMLAERAEVIVMAPTKNRSGAARAATYATPVTVEREDDDLGTVYACAGTPLDCIRIALLSDIAPDARLVVSGVNHGGNLGDDVLNSGTVAAAMEAALLGVPAIALSQQAHASHFHILDVIDRPTPITDDTLNIAVALCDAILAGPTPDRTVLNVNAPAEIREPGIEVTRLGRRYYPLGGLSPAGSGDPVGYLTYGVRGGPPPGFEDGAGTDFGAISAGRVAITPISYDWAAADESALRGWAEAVAYRAEEQVRPLWSPAISASANAAGINECERRNDV